MMAAPLGSILLGSADPDRLRAWYRDALAPEQTTDDQKGWIRFGAVGLLIDQRSDVEAKNPEPGRVILNLHVDDARATAAHLDRLGVTWLTEVEPRANGLFGTIVDPDGNYVQIIQLEEGYVPPW
jgi:hypothetical protein